MLVLIIAYLIYSLVAWWVYREHADKILFPDGKTGSLSIWNLRHLAGIALFFIYPVFVSTSWLQLFHVGIYSLPVIIAIVIAGYALLKLSIIHGFNLPYPVSRLLCQGQKYRVSLLLRGVFLVCYEFYFRGLLLFTLVGVVGYFSASIISTALYTLSHFGDAIWECIATIPFGFFLCWVTVETNSILPAILLHWFIALPGEIIASNKIVQPT